MAGQRGLQVGFRFPEGDGQGGPGLGIQERGGALEAGLLRERSIAAESL